MRHAHHGIPAFLAAALLALPLVAGCGGKTTAKDAADGVVDVAEVDGVVDPPADVPSDREVTGDAGEDAPEVDVVPSSGQPFETESAGGALLTSPNYKLELFVGPAGIRSPK